MDYVVWFYNQSSNSAVHLAEYLEGEFANKIICVGGLPDRLDRYCRTDGRSRGCHVYDDLPNSGPGQLAELGHGYCMPRGISWIILCTM